MRSLVAIVALAACGPAHVSLPPPSPTLGPTERIGYFMAMRPRAERFTEQNSQLTDHTVILANGIEVEDPEDLIAVVGPETATARAARDSRVNRRRTNIATIAVLAAIGAGIAIVQPSGDPAFGLDEDHAFLVAGIPVLVAAIAQYYFRHEDMNARARAFNAYTRDLGDRLNLCAHQMQIVPCEGTAPPPPAPAPAPAEPATTVPDRTALLHMR